MLRYLTPLLAFAQLQIRTRVHNERGASMVEYGLLVGLIAVVAIIAVTALGGGIVAIFSEAAEELGNPVTS